MLFKLSIKNMKKSFKDYAIYFLTLVLGVAIFYMFNSLDSQEAMLDISESQKEIIKLMISMLSVVSIFIAVILGLLIAYANKFLINRRKREFGIYMTLGMGRRQISKIILLETILVGILSLIAGLAFTLPKTTSSHACSFPLTNIHHIPHGEACGMTLDYFARINAKGADGARIDEFARKLGFKDTEEMADAIHELKAKMGLRNDLKDLHLTEEQISELVRISRHPNLYNNPVEITDEMLSEMYHKLA